MPSNDLASIVSTLIAAIGAKNWLFVTGAVIVGAVWALRTVVAPRVPFFGTDRGGALLALVGGMVSAASAVIFGTFSWQALLDGLLTAFVAAGGFSIVKKLFAPSDTNSPMAPRPVPAPEPAPPARM